MEPWRAHHLKLVRIPPGYQMSRATGYVLNDNHGLRVHIACTFSTEMNHFSSFKKLYEYILVEVLASVTLQLSAIRLEVTPYLDCFRSGPNGHDPYFFCPESQTRLASICSPTNTPNISYA
jgi:hypothetical protein